MEDVDVQKLSRKELLQLCADHNVRTAGVKQDDLVHLLQTKLRSPARATQKARSQINATNSPVSSPKARSQTNSPFSSPNAKGKPAERPAPRPINPVTRSVRPLNLVIQGDRSRNNSPEPSPKAPRKDQVSPNPGAPARKPTTIRSTPPPTLRSADPLHRKVNTLTALGKLQAQEKAQPGGGVGRSKSGPPVAKLDRGAPAARTRAAPKKNTKGPSPLAKRPGELIKSRINPSSPSSPCASEAPSVAATANMRSERGSPAASEFGTETQSIWDDDGDVVQSATSEPVPHERFQPPSTLGHDPRSSLDSNDAHSDVTSDPSPRAPQIISEGLQSPSTLRHGRRSSLDSNEAPLDPLQDPLQDVNNEPDGSFNLIGDAHTLDITSFLDAHAPAPETSSAPEPIDVTPSEPAGKKTSNELLGEKFDPLSTAECIIEGVHFNLDSAPHPHPHMERTSKNLRSASALGEMEKGLSKDDSCTTKSDSVELQTDGSEKVPLLQPGETGTTLLIRRTNLFPASILLWCSQLFYAIFGNRSNQ